MPIIASEGGLMVDGVLLQSALDMKVFLNMHAPAGVEVFIAGHQPVELEAKVDMHSPVGFNCYFTTFFESSLTVTLGVVQPVDLSVYLSSHIAGSLAVTFGVGQIRNLLITLWVVNIGQKDLQVWFSILRPDLTDLPVYLIPVRFRDFNIHLGGHSPPEFFIYLHGWVEASLSAYISAHQPADLVVALQGDPEFGIGFDVGLRTFIMSHFQVLLKGTVTQASLGVSLHGLFVNAMDVTLNAHGGIGSLYIELPMTTGFVNFNVRLWAEHRIISTYIALHTMEMSQFYVLLQQGWPCGFGSAFLNMSINFKAIPSGFLMIYLKAISGSGLLNLKAYLNTFGFPFYADKNIPVRLVIDHLLPAGTVPIFRDIPLGYDTLFNEVYQDKIGLEIPWPRLRMGAGDLGLSVFWVGVDIPKQLELSIRLYCKRPLPPPIPPQPGEISGVPDYFSAQEIPLFRLDPPEMVKVVKVMFSEQVYEYIWVPQLHTAFRKNIWEKWCLLGLGYLPDAYYAGQISYPYIQTMCNTGRFNTIDEAVRYLIDTMYWRGSFEMSVVFAITGSIFSFSVALNAWGKDNILAMRVDLIALQLSDLSIELVAV